MKTIIKTLFLILMAAGMISCAKYLDIVPDNVATLDHAFNTRITAKQFLFTCYSYLPDVQSAEGNPALWGGDEVTCYTNFRSSGHVHAWYIQRHNQDAGTSQRCNFWQGTNGGKDLYQGIRDCNIFLENIDLVPDMEQWEKDQWKAEVTFLKAYYHFYLTRMYGPIPIKDVNLPIDAEIDEVRVYRNTLDECFDYIVKTLDGVLAGGKLPDTITNEAAERGRITNGIVKAVKAEVLIYAASPLYNGNADYVNFVDGRGVEIFCPNKSPEEKLARWQAAADACAEAIEFLEGQGLELYSYSNKSYSDDTNRKMSIRLAFSEPWNSELIWGYTRTRVQSLQYQAVPRGFYASTGGTMGNGSVSLQMASKFYTKNGVPIDEDLTWNYADRYAPRTATLDEGRLIKSGYTTASFNFDREYRYYADLCFDGGVWFGSGFVDENNPKYIEAKSGQSCAHTTLNDFNLTGIWVKKWMNPNTTVSTSNTWSYTNFPFPIMRLSGLYLYYAEALNECGANYESVLPWINGIRERAGIPDVATSWDTYTNSPGKYKTQEGLREIIHRERTIELAFEGQRFWDVRRWKEAIVEYNKPFTGWTTSGSTFDSYYSEELIFNQQFEVKDYFWPVPKQEIFANPNTAQNYGWK